MKAPEKIFICDYGSEIGYEWHSESEFETKGHNGIEYTRTDAFIEKAETYLKEQFSKDVSILAGGVVHINFETAINNFIKYMKEE